MLSACASREVKQEGAGQQGIRKSEWLQPLDRLRNPSPLLGRSGRGTELDGARRRSALIYATQGDIKKLDSGDVIFYSGLHLEGNMTEIFEQIGKNKPVLAIADAIPKDQFFAG